MRIGTYAKSGKIIDAILTFASYTDPGTKEQRLCGFVQDITEQRKSEKKN